MSFNNFLALNAAVQRPNRAELVHICCCRADVALCGARVAGQDVKVVHPRHQGTPCLACLSKDQRRGKCSDPKCPGPDPEGAP